MTTPIYNGSAEEAVAWLEDPERFRQGLDRYRHSVFSPTDYELGMLDRRPVWQCDGGRHCQHGVKHILSMGWTTGDEKIFLETGLIHPLPEPGELIVDMGGPR